MRIALIVALALPLWAASKTESDALAEVARLRAQHATDLTMIETLKAQLVKAAAVSANNGVAIKKLGVQSAVSTAEIKQTIVDHADDAKIAVGAIKEAGSAIQEAGSQIIDSADSIRFETEKLRLAKTTAMIPVWLQLLTFGGILITSVTSLILGVINHGKVDVVAQSVNGAVDKIAVMSKAEGRAEKTAEVVAEQDALVKGV